MMIRADGKTRAAETARFAADESGAARTDRIVLVFGVAAVTALLALSLLGREADEPLASAGEKPSPTASTDAAHASAGTAPMPERRTISAVGRTAPEPPRVEGVEARPSHTSPGYLDRFEPRYDNEQAILNAQKARVVAEEDAARAAAAAAAPDAPVPQDEAAESSDGS